MSYISCHTLGSKSKIFNWSYDSNNGLSIHRELSTGKIVDLFSPLEIEEILQFTFKKGEVPLANSVDKMHKGIEKEGLGSYVYNNISKDVQKAQSMSQFAAIMVQIGVFEYNGNTRSMKFWLKNIDWQSRLINEK